MIDPQTEALYQVALGHYDREDDRRAAELFDAVLRRDPGHAGAAYKLGNLRKAAGRLGEAAKLYDRVLKREPGHAEARNNLGAVLQAGGRPEAAELCYREALRVRPSLAQPWLNLGRLLQEQGRNFEAAALYRDALVAGHDAGVFGHLKAAAEGATEGATGQGAPRAPDAYVRETFNAFAVSFDARLDSLGYRVPRRLADLLGAALAARPAPGGEARGLDVLDLGCGTGLSGAALTGLPGGLTSLTGVDLASAMLAEAQKRGPYTRLEQAEASAWLAAAPVSAFDVVIAADVFIYIGDMGPSMTAIARVLRPGGLFAFSVEAGDRDEAGEAQASGLPGGWRLLPSGRYAQTRGYVERLALVHGFRIAAAEPETIRQGSPGMLYLFEHPST